MIRVSTIFIAVCMVLVSASLGLVLYSLAAFTGSQSAIVALAALTVMILYNAVSMRLRDRTDAGTQIADLSRGTGDLARQVGELTQRLAAVEERLVSANSKGHDRIQAVLGEISELGQLVKQLAVSVASHEDLISAVRFDEVESASPGKLPAAASSDPMVIAESIINETPAHAPARSDVQILSMIRSAIEADRVDIYLQPMVTLPQRKVRFYEAVTRLRDADGQVVAADDFIATAEVAGLIGRIDHMVMLRCVQVLRRLMTRNKEIGLFCNVSAATLSSPMAFVQCLDFLEANRALAPSFILEFKQSTMRNLGPTEKEHLATLQDRGYRFSIDHVTDLRVDPRELADRGVRFIKVPATLLLDQRRASSDINAADLSDLLGRFGIDLIAERIEGERAVLDLLDYDVRFGQGFLFAAPRPLRPEASPAGEAAATQPTHQDADGFGSTASNDRPRGEPQRFTGNAALARRAGGPV